ncbi:unnamed protein product [Echinostoma caproni]|uniref:PAS domain-containing protein n=1 Tax=Echinostoma caproni TaxID=27848 RepID=A0A183A7U2_9TREM|nr:unnamed protein product [Echinostoma caproni]
MKKVDISLSEETGTFRLPINSLPDSPDSSSTNCRLQPYQRSSHPKALPSFKSSKSVSSLTSTSSGELNKSPSMTNEKFAQMLPYELKPSDSANHSLECQCLLEPHSNKSSPRSANAANSSLNTSTIQRCRRRRRPHHRKMLHCGSAHSGETGHRIERAEQRRERSRLAAQIRRNRESQNLMLLQNALPISTEVLGLHGIVTEAGGLLNLFTKEEDPALVEDLFSLLNPSDPEFESNSPVSNRHSNGLTTSGSALTSKSTSAINLEKADIIRITGHTLFLLNHMYRYLGTTATPTLSLHSQSLYGLLIDPTDMRIVYATPALAERIGWTWINLIGNSLNNVIHPNWNRFSSSVSPCPPDTDNRNVKIGAIDDTDESGCSSDTEAAQQTDDAHASLSLGGVRQQQQQQRSQPTLSELQLCLLQPIPQHCRPYLRSLPTEARVGPPTISQADHLQESRGSRRRRSRRRRSVGRAKQSPGSAVFLKNSNSGTENIADDSYDGLDPNACDLIAQLSQFDLSSITAVNDESPPCPCASCTMNPGVRHDIPFRMQLDLTGKILSVEGSLDHPRDLPSGSSLCGRPFLALVHLDDLERVLQSMQNVLRYRSMGWTAIYRISVQWPDSIPCSTRRTYRWVRTLFEPISDNNAALHCWHQSIGLSPESVHWSDMPSKPYSEPLFLYEEGNWHTKRTAESIGPLLSDKTAATPTLPSCVDSEIDPISLQSDRKTVVFPSNPQTVTTANPSPTPFPLPPGVRALRIIQMPEQKRWTVEIPSTAMSNRSYPRKVSILMRKHAQLSPTAYKPRHSGLVSLPKEGYVLSLSSSSFTGTPQSDVSHGSCPSVYPSPLGGVGYTPWLPSDPGSISTPFLSPSVEELAHVSLGSPLEQLDQTVLMDMMDDQAVLDCPADDQPLFVATAEAFLA